MNEETEQQHFTLEWQEQSPPEARCIVHIPADGSYFEGHFPDFPVLPAIAQLEMVRAAQSSLMGAEIAIRSIRKMKLRKPVYPGDSLLLKLSSRSAPNSSGTADPAQRISFTFTAASLGPGGDGEIISTGEIEWIAEDPSSAGR